MACSIRSIAQWKLSSAGFVDLRWRRHRHLGLASVADHNRRQQQPSTGAKRNAECSEFRHGNSFLNLHAPACSAGLLNDRQRDHRRQPAHRRSHPWCRLGFFGRVSLVSFAFLSGFTFGCLSFSRFFGTAKGIFGYRCIRRFCRTRRASFSLSSVSTAEGIFAGSFVGLRLLLRHQTDLRSPLHLTSAAGSSVLLQRFQIR